MANRYWVGGSGTWNTTSTTNWSTSSNGPSGASVPTAADSVFFDQAGPYTVTMTGALNCLDITVSGASVTFATGTTPTLSVAGSWSTIAGTLWNSTGTVTFTSTTSRTITSGGITIDTSFTFNGTGGTWTLQDNLTLNTTRTATLTSGTLALGTFTLTTGLFASSGAVARTLNFGTGKIVLNPATTSTVWDTGTITSLTVSGTPLVECIGGGTAVTKTINTGALSLANSISFSLLETTGSVTYTFTASNTVRNLLINGSQAISNIAITIYGNYTYLDTNGVTSFIGGANAWTFLATSGTQSITSTPSNTFGASVYFDGTSDNLLLSYNSALHLSADFTIECWFYARSYGGMILNFAGGLNIAWASYELVNQSDGINFAASSANSGYDIGSETGATGRIGTIKLGTWNHIAVTRSGNVYRGFVNGVQGYTQTLNLTPYDPNARGLAIGSNYTDTWGSGNPTNTVNGYISNLRIIKGTALYTSNFTPPTSALTAVPNTVLLTCQSSSTITDASSNAFPITVVGNTGPSLLMVNEPLYDFPITVNSVGATVQLQSNITVGPTRTFTLTAGTFNLNNYILTTGIFASSGSTTRTLAFGTGKIELCSTATATIWNTGTVTGMTVTGTPLVECIGGGSAVTKTINTGALSLANSISFSLLETTGSVTYAFTASNVVRNLLINGSQRISNIAITIYGNYTYLDTNGVTNFIGGANAWTFGATSGTQSITSTPTNTFGASVYFGTGLNTAQLSVPDNDALDFGTGDFTIECFFNAFSLSGNSTLLEKWASTATGGWQLYWRGTGTSLAFAFGNAGSVGTVILQDSNPNRIAVGGWYHVAVARQGTTTNMFVNGILVATTNTDSNDYTSTFNVGIGKQISTNSNSLPGYISNVRIVKGTAVYTANFTPPNSNLTNIAGTSLLTCQSSSTITDNSSYAFPITIGTQTAPSLLMVNEPLYDFPITVNSVGATVQLQSNITVGSTRTFTLTGGTFNLNNLILTTGIFASSGSTTRTLAFGTGKIELYSIATATIWNTGTVTNMTVTGTPLVECSGGGGAVTKTINTGALTEANSISFSLLETIFYTFAQTVTYAFTSNNTVKNLIINGNQIISNIAATIFGEYTYDQTNGISRFTAGANAWTFGATSGSRTFINNPVNVFGASTYFDASGDYLSVGTTSSFKSLHGSSALFTIEAFIWHSTTATTTIFSTCPTAAANIGIVFQVTSGQMRLIINNGVSAVLSATAAASTAAPGNRWVHVAVTYDQSLATNNCKFYIDGKLVDGTFSKTAQTPSSADSTTSGRIHGTLTTADASEAFISNLRICDSIVYTANFTPPTSNLTAISGTLLLTCQSSTNPITDASTNAYAITVSGNTTASPWQVNSIIYDFPWIIGSAVSTAVWTLTNNQSQGPTRNFTLAQGTFDFNGYSLIGGNLGVATGTVTVNNTVGNSNINLGIPVNQSSGNVTFNPNLIVSNWAGYTLSAGNLTILDNRIVQTNAFITSSSSNRIIAFSNSGELRLTGAGVNTAIGCTSPNTYFVFSASNGSNLTYTGNVYFNITDTGSVGNRMLNFTQNATTTLSAPMNITTAGNRGVVINPSATDNIILHGNFYNVDFTGMNAKLFLGGGYSANIYGNFIMANSGNPDPQANSFPGSIIFTGNTAATFTTYDQTVAWGLTLNTANNTSVTQIGNLISIHPNSIANFSTGNYNLNGYFINVGQLVFNTANIKEIDFTTVGSKINVIGGNQSVGGGANSFGNTTIFTVASSSTNFPTLKGNWIINFTYAGNGGSATGYRQLDFANAISNTVRNTYYKLSSVLDTPNSFNLNPTATDTLYFTNNSHLFDLNLTNVGSNVNLLGNLSLANSWTISNMAGNFYINPANTQTSEIRTIGSIALQSGNCTIDTNDKAIYARANFGYANTIVTSNLNLRANTSNASNIWHFRLDMIEANLTINSNVFIKSPSLYGIYSTTNKFISWGENSVIELYGNSSQANFSTTVVQQQITLFLGNVGNITQTGNPNIYLSYAGSTGNRFIKYNSGNANGNLVGSGSFLSLTTGSSPGIVINPSATDNIGVTDFISGGDSNPSKFLDFDLRGFAGNFLYPGSFSLTSGQTIYVAGNLWSSANTKWINTTGNSNIRLWPSGGNSNSGRSSVYLLAENNTVPWTNANIWTSNNSANTLGVNVTLGSNFTINVGTNAATNSQFVLAGLNANLNLNNYTFTCGNYTEAGSNNRIINFGDTGYITANANNSRITSLGSSNTIFQGNVNVFINTANSNTYTVSLGGQALANGYALRFANEPLNNTITVGSNSNASVNITQTYNTDAVLDFGSLTIGPNSSFSFTGNITIPAAQNVAVQTTSWTWNIADGNTVYMNGGNVLKPIALSMTGLGNNANYIISNSFRSNQSVTFSRGNLYLNGNELEAGNLTFTGSNTTTRRIIWDSGNLIINRGSLSFGGSLANNSTETTFWSNGNGVGRYKFTFTSNPLITCNVGNNNSVVALNGILDIAGTGTLTTNGNVGFTDLVCSNFVANATRNLRTERACTLSFSTTLRLDNFTVGNTANGRILDIRSNSQTDGSWNIITTTSGNVMGANVDWLRVANIRFTPTSVGNPLNWYLGTNSNNQGNVTGAVFTTLDVVNGYYKAIQLTTGSAFVVPNDWNNANNEIHMWGGGGGGAASTWNGSTDRAGGGGGGGGGYTKISNLALTPGNTITYTIGAGGAAGQNKAISPTYNDQGSNGGNTTFVVTPTTYTAGGGFRGTTTNAPGVGQGGNGGVGTTFTGGRGGNGSSGIRPSSFPASAGGGGGGGAAGPFGNGGNGGSGAISQAPTSNRAGGGGGGGYGGGFNGANGNGSLGYGGQGGNNRLGLGGGAETSFSNPGSNGGGGSGTGNLQPATPAFSASAGSQGIDLLGTFGGGAGSGGGASWDAGGIFPSTPLAYGMGGGAGGQPTATGRGTGCAGVGGQIVILYAVPGSGPPPSGNNTGGMFLLN